ncbi:hypothetical protein TeGR_g7031, partial [Tetraparma gracilis]
MPLLPFPAALRTVLSHASAAAVGWETMPLAACTGRISSSEVLSPFPHPRLPTAIMDGYALRSSELASAEPASAEPASAEPASAPTFSISPPVYAGDSPPAAASPALSASYVTTGAAVPAQYDCVVPIESCAVAGSSLTCQPYSLPANRNVRLPGSDVPEGAVLVREGQEVTPAVVGLLATFGIGELLVVRSPRVGVLSCGSELVDPIVDPNASEARAPRLPSHIHDCNRPMLLSYLSTLSPAPTASDLGIVKDEPEALRSALLAAVAEHDVIVTSAGVSAGEKDYVAAALEAIGATVHFSRLNLKPGKPTTFSTVKVGIGGSRTVLILSLPGNPVSCLVCATLLLMPMLAAIGSAPAAFATVRATLQDDVKLDAARPEFHRVVLRWGAAGYSAFSTGHQQSSKMVSFFGAGGEEATGLLCLPAGGEVQGGWTRKGEVYDCIMRGLPVRGEGAEGAEGAEGTEGAEGAEGAKVIFVGNIPDREREERLRVGGVVGCVDGRGGWVATGEAGKEVLRVCGGEGGVPSLVLVVHYSREFDNAAGEAVRAVLDQPAPQLECALQRVCEAADPMNGMRPVVVGGVRESGCVVVCLHGS